MAALCCVSRLVAAVLHTGSPCRPHTMRFCQSRTNMLWVWISTENSCALSGRGDQSCHLPPNCQLGQGTGILINEQQPNNDHNFQVAYGNLSGQHVKAFYLEEYATDGETLEKNFFLLEPVVLCWFRSMAMARILCHTSTCPPLPIAFSFPPHARQSQGRSDG